MTTETIVCPFEARGKTKKDGLVAEAESRALEYFGKGLCCSEAVVRAIMEVYAPGTPLEGILPLASGFCGGMGDRQGICGVYSGGILALGQFAGRRRSGDSDRVIRRLSGLFQSRLEGEIQAVLCKDVLKRMRFRNWRKKGCRSLTGLGARLVAGIIEENGLDRSKPA